MCWALVQLFMQAPTNGTMDSVSGQYVHIYVVTPQLRNFAAANISGHVDMTHKGSFSTSRGDWHVNKSGMWKHVSHGRPAENLLYKLAPLYKALTQQ